MSISNQSNYILELKDLTVRHGTELLLNKVNLKVKKGEIYAIIGDKDSGKSTLVDVISGITPKTNGIIIFDNKIFNYYNPSKVRSAGIETIYRDGNIFLMDALYENLFVGRWPKKSFICIDKKAMRDKAKEVIHLFLSDRNIDIDAPLKNYSDNIRNIVDIVKSFCVPSKLLIVDEISKRLDPHQYEKFRYLLSLQREKGTAILYISNSIEEIYNFADCVSIMKNGKVIDTYNLSNYDKVQLVLLTYSHLYNRKELERSNFELFYLKNLNESIINNIPFAILVVDTRGKIILANKRFSIMFQVNPEKFINRHFNELLNIRNENLPEIENGITSAEVIKIYPLRSVLLEGYKNVVLHLLPLYDQDNAFLGTIFFFSDLFEIVNIEMQLRNFKKNEGFKKSITGLAHEIRNPLAIIINFLKIIKHADSLEHIRENADRIEKEISRLKDVISDLLSRFHTEKDELRDLIYLEKFFNEVKGLLVPTMKDKNIDLKLTLREDVALHIEPELFKQVVMNLIINSIEAMPSGGYIHIYDSIKNLNNQWYYVINFTDNGLGIKKENIPYIFDPFFTTKQSDEIRGLGLSICKDIITKYKGFINVNSRFNKGSTFHVFFPGDIVICKKRQV